MSFRLILFVVLGFFIFNSLTYTHVMAKHADWDDDEMPDTTRRNNPDSLRRARAHTTDSIQKARKRSADSVKISRKQKTDSLQSARKRVTDSSASVRKYHDSKHYKDSVTRARNSKSNSLKDARQARMDSIAQARKTSTDSLTAVRKTKTDGIKTVQKRRTDSLAKVKKYKTSKRYADSVTIVRHLRADSVKAVQKEQRDRLASARKHTLDSSKAVRTKSMDSVKAVRTKHLDSIKMVRKSKTDSLTKAKKLKENLAKSKEKNKDEDKKLKLELKIKQKRQEWSNAKMLKKRWGPIRRFLQNSFTHYNYYYNAKKKMGEAEANMQRSRKENYDSLLGLYPFDPNRDSSLLSSDMDTIVRKISVGIQIHDPRVKWSNDLYLLLGEAYYYRGQYENASIAFRYIISKDEEAKKAKAKKSQSKSSKEEPTILEDEHKSGFLGFLKHKSVHNEAILWLARTYTEAHQVENAESILSLLETDKLPDNLKGRLAIEKAFAYLTENNYPAAATQLASVLDDNNLPNWLRMRAAFIHGQLLQNMGDYKNAAKSFERVLAYYPKLEMDFYSRKYVAYNKLQSGENIEEAIKPLKKVLNDGKYVSYYDQVYFVLGQLAAKANQNRQAITYFTKSATTPRATKKQKALSYASLGDVYYATTDYAAAKRSYDSAAKYSSGAKETGMAVAMQRSKGLEDVSGPSKVIRDQDSLLALANLSKREQQSVVRKHIRDLEKRRADSISNALNSEVVALPPSEEAPADKEAANWYFGNTTLVQQGSADFKRKWGTRPLVDNWRRTSALPFATAKAGEDEDFADLGDGGKDIGDVTEESLLAKIPNTPQQKEQAIKLQQRAYMQLAKAYVKQLEDYNMAVLTLDTLDSRFPNHAYKEDELYLRYQIAMKQNKLDLAKSYADQLVAKFPNSQYAGIVRPKHSESKQDEMIAGKTVSGYFDETYDLLLKHQYTEALMRITAAKKQFDNPTYQKRFEVAEAMGNAGAGNYDQADSTITKFLRTYPADTLTAWATTVKNYIKEVRNGGKPSWYKEGPYVAPAPASAGNAGPDTVGIKKDVTAGDATEPKLAGPSEPVVPSDAPPAYYYSADTPHYCIIVLPGIDSRTSGLKKAVKELNAAKYSSNNFELLFDLYHIDQGVLVVKKFANATEAKTYLTDLLASDAVKGYAPGELQLAVISGVNYKKMFADKKAEPYFTFYTTNYK